jgi:hypothetical protein
MALALLGQTATAQGIGLMVDSWLCKLPAVMTKAGEIDSPACASASATQVLQVRSKLKLRRAG